MQRKTIISRIYEISWSPAPIMEINGIILLNCPITFVMCYWVPAAAPGSGMINKTMKQKNVRGMENKVDK